MNNYSVFRGLQEAELSELQSCLVSGRIECKKGEKVMTLTGDNNEVCIVEKGLIYLVSLSNSGEENIIDYYEEGGIFSGRLIPDTNVNLFNIIAKKPSKLLTINYEKIVGYCKNNCLSHQKFIRNVIETVSCRNQMHIDILSQRTIRGKLMVYFSYYSEKVLSREFTLPIPIADLADYICADRSAIMREIKKLNTEGLIASHGQVITLLRTL